VKEKDDEEKEVEEGKRRRKIRTLTSTVNISSLYLSAWIQ
jgi:hypothetical protein